MFLGEDAEHLHLLSGVPSVAVEHGDTVIEHLCYRGGNLLMLPREDEELHRCTTCVHHSVEHEVLDDHGAQTEHNLIDPVDWLAEFGNEKTAADDKQVDTYQHLAKREIVELVHTSSNDVRSSGRTVVEEYDCQRRASEATSYDKRHELLPIAKYSEEFAIAARDDVLSKLQHEVECYNGVDGLHHESEPEYAQGHNEQCYIDNQIAVFNSEACGIEDDSRHTGDASCNYLVWKQKHRPSEGVEQQAESDEDVIFHFTPDEFLPICHGFILLRCSQCVSVQ